MNDQELEKTIVERGLTKPRVTLEHIEEIISRCSVELHRYEGTTTVVATVFTEEGFSLATEISACASPENFREDIGFSIAKNRAFESARNELWKLEGYMLKNSLSKEAQTVERIAKVAHEINAAYCKAMGDDSQTSWEDAPLWQKDSAIAGVVFHLDNPDASPRSSHEIWMKEKTKEGWTYGEVKDVEAKTHPCYLPYDELPVEQKAKDYLFKQVIESLR